MHIKTLNPTQSGLRSQLDLQQLIAKVRWGERLSPPIKLVQFPDGYIYVMDGHHRLAAIWQSREYLYDGEFTLSFDTYERYLEINPKVGWVTPFDPRIEVRVPDFSQFKARALEIFRFTGYNSAREYVLQNLHTVILPRTIYHIKDLVK